MAATAPPKGDPDQQKRARSPEMAEADAPEVWPEVDALVEENKALKDLVVRLSTLVVRNVVEDH